MAKERAKKISKFQKQKQKQKQRKIIAKTTTLSKTNKIKKIDNEKKLSEDVQAFLNTLTSGTEINDKFDDNDDYLEEIDDDNEVIEQDDENNDLDNDFDEYYDENDEENEENEGNEEMEDDNEEKVVKKSKGEKNSAMSKHKEELEKLKEKDPEFFAFLQENDKELLNFGDDVEEDEEDDEEDPLDLEDENDADEKPNKKKKKEKEKITLTIEMIDQWIDEALKKNSLKALKKLIIAFKLGCHLSEENEEENNNKNKNNNEKSSKKNKDEKNKKNKQSNFSSKNIPFKIRHSEVFNHIMVTGILQFIHLFNHFFQIKNEDFGIVSFDHLINDNNNNNNNNNNEEENNNNNKNKNNKNNKNDKNNKKDNKKDNKNEENNKNNNNKKKISIQFKLTSHKSWQKLKLSLKSFLSSLLHFAEKLTDEKMTSFILKQFSSPILLHYFAAFSVLSRKLLKTIIKIWSTTDETNRIYAFLALREMSLLMPPPFLDQSIKQSYLTFVKNSNFTNRKTLGTIQFMSNCVVELCGIDFKTTYQHAFTYIRLLAVQLRNAVTSSTKKEKEVVYGWGYVHSLSLWTNVICAYPNQPEVLLLLFPLSQVIMGTIKVMGATKHLPVHFQCVRMLHRLTAATSVFIPTSPFILPALESKDFKKKMYPSKEKRMDWMCVLRVPNNLLHTKTLTDDLILQICELLLENFSHFAFSISFPEFVFPSIVLLKKFIKNSKVSTYRKPLKELVLYLEKNSAFILTERRKINFASNDMAKIENFLADKKAAKNSPLSRYYSHQQKLLEEKRKSDENSFILQENNRKNWQKNKGKKGGDDEDEDDDEDDDNNSDSADDILDSDNDEDDNNDDNNEGENEEENEVEY